MQYMTKAIDLVVSKAVEILAIRNCSFDVVDGGGNRYASRDVPTTPVAPKKKYEFYDLKPLNLDEFVKQLSEATPVLEYATPSDTTLETIKWAVNRACRYVHGKGVCTVRANETGTGVVITLRVTRESE